MMLSTIEIFKKLRKTEKINKETIVRLKEVIQEKCDMIKKYEKECSSMNKINGELHTLAFELEKELRGNKRIIKTLFSVLKEVKK